jgi:hypothetical protein
MTYHEWKGRFDEVFDEEWSIHVKIRGCIT